MGVKLVIDQLRYGVYAQLKFIRRNLPCGSFPVGCRVDDYRVYAETLREALVGRHVTVGLRAPCHLVRNEADLDLSTLHDNGEIPYAERAGATRELDDLAPVGRNVEFSSATIGIAAKVPGKEMHLVPSVRQVDAKRICLFAHDIIVAKAVVGILALARRGISPRYLSSTHRL